MNDNNESGRRSLLRKIQAAGVRLREIEGGRPFNILKFAIKQSGTSNPENRIAPPTYGFDSLRSFLDTMFRFLPPSDRWILAILVCPDLMAWVARETRGEGPRLESVSALDQLGTVPIAMPNPDIQERLGVLVERVVTEVDGSPSQLEIRSDLEDRVISIYGMTCEEIGLVVGNDVEW